MSAEENKAIVRRFYEQAINTGNLHLAEQLLAPDYQEHPPLPGGGTGFQGFKQFVAMISTSFPDLHVAIKDIVAEGDKVAVRLTVSGTHKGALMGKIPPTGKHVTWRGLDIIRIADGKIVERWSERDLLGLMQELGAIPEGR